MVRDRVPLIYWRNNLIAVADYWFCDILTASIPIEQQQEVTLMMMEVREMIKNGNPILSWTF